ncbi:MAG: hypothetical protein LLF97_01555 [Planctomycetaceae bacterium]|nr:hypothetical protein [Planctomycetaceae bacterium]
MAKGPLRHEKLLADGHMRFGNAIRSEYRQKLAELELARKSAETELQRLEIDAQIARLTATYRAQRTASGRSLF